MEKTVETPQDGLMERGRRVNGYLLLLLLLLLGAIPVSIAMYLCRDQKTNRETTKENFTLIAIGLGWFSDGCNGVPFPIQYELIGEPSSTYFSGARGTGRPLCSWRVSLIPAFESWHGQWDRSQPWNSPANEEVSREFYKFFSYDTSGTHWNDPSFVRETNALAITGPGTAFGDGVEHPKRLTEIPQSTVLVVEVRSSGIHWMEPGDFDIRTMPETINAPDGKGISSIFAGGFHVIFADGNAWFLSDKIPFATLRSFFTIEEAGKHDREKELGPYALYRN